MADASGSMVVMGRVVGPYGVKGWLKIQPFTETVEALCDYPSWWLGRESPSTQPEWLETEVIEAVPHGAVVVAQLAGIDSREAAGLLKGSEIAVPRAALPETAEEEFYWADLIGFEVVNEQGEALGQVAGHFSNSAHDVMRVQDGERERLLPWVEAVVREVDEQGRRIKVDWQVDW